MVQAAPVAAPTTDPTYLYDIAEGMHAIEALTASIGWLNLFEWLAGSPADEAAICTGLGLAPRPARVLLTLLATIGLLQRDDAGVYRLTPLAEEHLLRSSPWSLAPCFDALKDRPACQEMLAVLQTGRALGAPGEDDGEPPPWAAGMNDEAFAEFFLQAIDSRNAYLAHVMAERLDLSGSRRLLDVGGGSGIYACALAVRNPGLQATVLEKPPVDAVARRAIARRGLADRVSVVSGDMLAGPLPDGYDVHLYSNVVHDWDEDLIRVLLRASHAALPAGGRIVIHDALLDDGPAGAGGNGATRTGRRAVAEYSVLLMAFTAGRCYSVGELCALLEEAGFVDVTHQPTVVHRSLIVATTPRAGAGR